jgi:hypothetical protein
LESEDQTTTTRTHKEKENERFFRENARKIEEIDKKKTEKEKEKENWEFADLYGPRKLILEGEKPSSKQSRRSREVRSVS